MFVMRLCLCYSNDNLLLSDLYQNENLRLNLHLHEVVLQSGGSKTRLYLKL